MSCWSNDELLKQVSMLEHRIKELELSINLNHIKDEKLHKQNIYLATLHETALSLMDRLSLSELLEVIVKRAGELLKTPHGFIYLVRPDQDVLKLEVAVGVYQHYLGVLRKKNEPSVSSMVWKTKKTLVIPNITSWEGKAKDRPYGWDTVNSVMGIPMKSDGEVTGVIGLGFVQSKKRFSKDEVILLTRFAELASIALDNAKLYTKLQTELEQRRRAENALRESESNYREIFNAVNDYIFVIDVETGSIVDVNQKVMDEYNCRCQDVECIDMILNNLANSLSDMIHKIMHSNNNEKHVVLWKIPWNHNKTTWLEIDVKKAIIGGENRYLAVARDVTERKNNEEQLEFQAYHDVLTGLPNRRKFEQDFNLILCQAQKSLETLAFVFLDLDGFKKVNDTFGHDAGDFLLKEITKNITRNIRQEDIIARLGGDEFVLILRNIKSKEDLILFIKRIQQACRRSIQVNEQTVFVTASIGVSIYPNDGHDVQTLLKNSDLAMYKSKKIGKEKYCFWK